jgi:hypothetical protein
MWFFGISNMVYLQANITSVSTVRTCAQEMKIGADQLWKSYRHVSSSLVSLC